MRLRTILIYLAFSLALAHASYGQVTFGQSVPVVSALPATCTAVGSSNSSSSVQYQGTFYYCSATNTWTAYGSGGGGGTPAGSSGDYQINNGGSFGAGVISQLSGRTTITPTAASSGVASYHRLITPADTTLTASTESIGAQFGGNTSAATVTRQWATGALTTQRENLFVAPTYAFAGASTLTTAVNVEAASPTAGTNATLTNSYAARFIASAAAHVPLVVKGATSQIGDLQQWQNSANTKLAYIDSNGSFNNSVAVNAVATFYSSAGNPQLIFGVNTTTYMNLTWDSNVGLIQTYGRSYPVGLDASSIQLKTGAAERVSIDNTGLVGVNKTSSIGAQLHTVSGSASRISGLFEAAASNSAAVLVSKSGSSGTGNLFEAQNSSGTVQMAVTPNGSLALTGIAFSALGSTNGVLVYCTDCAVTSGADNTCTSGGSGALAIRLNGVQRCFIAQN